MTEHAVLNQNVWINARNWFESQREQTKERMILPIVNEKQQLICFACEDFDANMELRMLRELQSRTGMIGFKEVYPECQCVILNRFNKLAYVFAEYLQSEKIAVKVNGTLWDTFFQSDERQLSFTRKQVEEMFRQDFPFMQELQFEHKKDKSLFNIQYQLDTRVLLRKVRRIRLTL